LGPGGEPVKTPVIQHVKLRLAAQSRSGRLSCPRGL